MADWETGRQNSGYFKKLLWRFERSWLGLDLYLLHYPTGSFIDQHSDLVPGKSHWRINLVYQDCDEGGNFRALTSLINFRRLNIFRSDDPHCVSLVERGERRVLSIGIAI